MISFFLKNNIIGTISLEDIRTLEDKNEKCFLIHTENRVFQVQAITEEEYQKWFSYLKLLISQDTVEAESKESRYIFEIDFRNEKQVVQLVFMYLLSCLELAN